MAAWRPPLRARVPLAGKGSTTAIALSRACGPPSDGPADSGGLFPRVHVPCAQSRPERCLALVAHSAVIHVLCGEVSPGRRAWVPSLSLPDLPARVVRTLSRRTFCLSLFLKPRIWASLEYSLASLGVPQLRAEEIPGFRSDSASIFHQPRRPFLIRFVTLLRDLVYAC